MTQLKTPAYNPLEAVGANFPTKINGTVPIAQFTKPIKPIATHLKPND